ncbi:hypothetical protein AAMO2058_001014500 [Amorphochlora amoebiformis]
MCTQGIARAKKNRINSVNKHGVTSRMMRDILTPAEVDQESETEFITPERIDDFITDRGLDIDPSNVPLNSEIGSFSPSGLEDPNASRRASRFPTRNLTQGGLLRALWFLFGATNAFIGPGLTVYLTRDVEASPHKQATIAVLISVAWNLKMVAACASDSFAICGYRRKAYLVGGVGVYVSSFILLGILSVKVTTTATLLFFANVGEMVSSVMMDTFVVEEVRTESKENKGNLQTHCWILLTIGGISGTLVGGFAAKDWESIGNLFLVNAALKVPVLPLVYLLREREREAQTLSPLAGRNSGEISGENRPFHFGPHFGNRGTCWGTCWDTCGLGRLRETVGSVWRVLKQPEICKPTWFLFMFSIMPDASSIMPVYYVVELGFSSMDLAYIMVFGGLAGACGLWIYNRFLKRISWRIFFTAVVILVSCLSVSQLILVFGLSSKAGLPDLLFAIGDDVLIDMSRTWMGTPILILIATLCPKGAEGTVYASITSIQIGGATISASISAMLIQALGITLSDFSGLWQLIVICSGIRLCVLPFIPLLPGKVLVKTAQNELLEDLDDLQTSPNPKPNPHPSLRPPPPLKATDSLKATHSGFYQHSTDDAVEAVDSVRVGGNENQGIDGNFGDSRGESGSGRAGGRSTWGSGAVSVQPRHSLKMCLEYPRLTFI